MYAAVTIMAVLTLLAAGLAATVRKIIHDREIHKYYEAARRIIQEEHLNYAIKNPLNGHGERPQMQKIMLCLKTENNIMFLTRKRGSILEETVKKMKSAFRT